ncbi:hypothetical protein AB0Y20_11745 [Heyndrickxia oleronia]|uniref:hypothetical protein n=1 Tax=Heyndrickxia oleronia TaxID=38875 RepID=UPI003F2429B8
MQKLNDRNIKIEGLSLPKSIQISIDNRNDNGNNHILVNGEIKVLCSKCKQYHPVFKLANGQWLDINRTYWVSKTRDSKEEYFGTKCTKCYKNRGKMDGREPKKVESVPIIEDNPKKEGEYLPHSKKNGGIQQTIFLEPANDEYLKWFAFVNKKRKNKLINEVIAKFKENNPINL